MLAGKVFSRSFLVFALALASVTLAYPEYVYIADEREPREVEAEDGFSSPGLFDSPLGVTPDINLYRHAARQSIVRNWDQSGYVVTTASRDVALNWMRERQNGNGYVYMIHVTPNFIDVEGTLGDYNPGPDVSEFAALGRIPFDQTVGWARFENGIQQNEVGNPRYDRRRYETGIPGGPQPQLAGFPEGHEAWEQEFWRPHASCTDSKKLDTRQNHVCKAKKSNLAFAAEYMAKQIKVDCVGVQINLTSNWTAGTTDTVLLGFRGSQYLTEVYDDPSYGDSSTVVLKLKTLFNSSQVTLYDLMKPDLLQRPTPHPLFTDDFQVHSIVFEALIPRSLRRLRNSKYASMNKWLGTKSSGVDLVWSGTLDPMDWKEISDSDI